MDIKGFLLGLVQNHGMLGVFMACFLSAASIVLPTPTPLIILAAARIFDPLSVALLAGFATALGELTAYVLAREGRMLLKKEHKAKLEDFKKKVDKYGPLLVFGSACIPGLPFDYISISAGLIAMDAAQFTAAVILGRLVYSVLIITFGNGLINGV